MSAFRRLLVRRDGRLGRFLGRLKLQHFVDRSRVAAMGGRNRARLSEREKSLVLCGSAPLPRKTLTPLSVTTMSPCRKVGSERSALASPLGLDGHGSLSSPVSSRFLNCGAVAHKTRRPWPPSPGRRRRRRQEERKASSRRPGRRPRRRFRAPRDRSRHRLGRARRRSRRRRARRRFSGRAAWRIPSARAVE